MGVRQWTAVRESLVESDEQLTDRVRGGDQVAFGELYQRHRKAAESTARCLLRSRTDADDVVSDAFAGVLSAIRSGHGPRDNFRRYLLACVRNGCRVRRRLIPVAPEDRRFDPDRDPDAPVLEDPERYVEANTVARAFAALSPRWQQMLWSTAVEQKTAQEVGQQMSLSPNAAAALAHRAREAFATAYLSEHVGLHSSPDCDRYSPHLAGLVRGQLPAGRAAAVEQHVAACLTCSAAVADLRDVNTSLRTLAPAPGMLVPLSAAEVAITRTGVAGTSIGSSAGIPFAGLLVKGLAGLLLLAPILLTNASGFDGGTAEGLREPLANQRGNEQGAPTSRPQTPPTTAPVVSGLPTDPPSGADPGGGARDESNAANAEPDIELVGVSPGAGGPNAGTLPASVTTVASDPTTGGPNITAPAITVTPTSVAPITLAPPTTTRPVTSPPTTEGLLGTLGVDDVLSPAGLDVVSDTIDAAVLALTSEVVAPLLAAAIQGLDLPLDLSVLPPIPGVVLVPPTVPGATTVPPSSEVPLPGVSLPGVSLPGLALPSNPGPVTTRPSSPSAANPPATDPPATSPPATSPPATSPPVTSPPATNPPPTSPPATTNPGLLCNILGIIRLC